MIGCDTKKNMNKNVFLLMVYFSPMMLDGMDEKADLVSDYVAPQLPQPCPELFSHRGDMMLVMRTALIFAKMVQTQFFNSKTDVDEMRVSAQLEVLAAREKEVLNARDGYLFDYGDKGHFFAFFGSDGVSYLYAANVALVAWMSDVWKLVESVHARTDISVVATPPLYVDSVQLLDSIEIPLIPISGTTLVVDKLCYTTPGTFTNEHSIYGDCWYAAFERACQLGSTEIGECHSSRENCSIQ